MNKLVNENVNKIIEKVIKECSKHYGFNSEEAMIRLGLVEEEKVVVKEKVVNEKVKEKKIPLPFNVRVLHDYASL